MAWQRFGYGEIRVGFLPWQKVFLLGQWKNRQKLAKTYIL